MTEAHGNGLRHRADRRSLAFVVATLAVLTVPLFAPPPPLLAVPWVVLAALLCFSVCIVNHNHVHRPMFGSSAANRVLDVVLSVAKGHSANGVVVAHNLNHHRHGGGPGDWIRPEIAGGGAGALRLGRYLVRATLAMARGRNAPDAPRLPDEIRRSLLRERAAIAAFAAFALATAGPGALVYVGLPWLAATVALVGVNLLQHDGCIPGSPHDQARNFTGALGNWFFFNAGYHTAHHLHPRAHWTDLRALHVREVRPCMDPRLEQTSILRFLVRAYLLGGSGARERLMRIGPGSPGPSVTTTGTAVPK